MVAMSLAMTLLAAAAPSVDYDAAARELRGLLVELVAADTTNPPGNEARAAAIGAERLKREGISFEIHAFASGRENLVARVRGDGREPPLLLLAHTDVVTAEGQPWSTPPHQLTERTGFLVGRGSSDDLGMAATELEVLLLLHRTKVPLSRDIVMAWTDDEESGGAGIRLLLEQRPELIGRPAFVLNEGGRPTLGEDGKVQFVSLGAAEKVNQDFTLRARGKTGHSSVPLGDNAIVRLAKALGRIDAHRFPARLLPVTRAYFRSRAALEPPDVAAAMRAVAQAPVPPQSALLTLEKNPSVSALLRTTCVATLVSGGTRVNALPAEATANVNCRILPDETIEDVRRVLAEAIAVPGVDLELGRDVGSAGASPVEGDAPSAIERVVRRLYGTIPIIPAMGTGYTDCRYLRARGVPCYGLNPLGLTEADARRAHGIDERIPIASLRTGVELLHALVLELAARR